VTLPSLTSIAERVDQEELLDLGQGSLAEVRCSLDDVARINRWLGGHAALRRYLYPRLQEWRETRPPRIVDVGAGAADVALEIAHWAAQRGRPVRITALDSNARHLALARAAAGAVPGIELLQADARRLPLRSGSFDFVLATLFVHHFNAAELRAMLPILAGVARRTVVLNDLVRDRLPLLFFRAARPWIARSPITWHDGLASIRRAYTPREMEAILRDAALSHARIYRDRLYYRMTIVIERDSS
jgi:SAM-dependent methyltransferase